MYYTKKYALLFQMLCEKYGGADLKTSQKMFYFFERKGITLNLRYGIHYYGPYSSKLEDAMDELESEGYITIDTSGTTHMIHSGSKSISEDALSPREKDIAEYVLKTFEHKSPIDLEALTTMDYIANSLLSPNAAKDDIIDKFKQIKGDKFHSKIMEHTFNELTSLQFITTS